MKTQDERPELQQEHTQELQQEHTQGSQPSRTSAKPLRGWNWGKGIALVYSAFALATIAFAVFSFSQKVELVSADYYEREMAYNSHEQRIANTASLSQQVQLRLDAQARTVNVHFPVPGATGTVLLYRPSASGLDRSFAIACDATGNMNIDVHDLASGEWRAQITWTSASTPFYHECRIRL